MESKQSDFTHEDLEGYDSSFESDEEKREVRRKKKDLTNKNFQQPNVSQGSSAAIPSKAYFDEELRRAEGYRNRYFALNAFERHQKLINDYFLYFPGAKKLLGRDSSKDKRDIDVVREHHRFLWTDSDSVDSWEKQLAKAYYDKLYKEYTICDLSKYLENKVAMRWRIEKELLDGKGQFICGAKRCEVSKDLKTWEVNFAYLEDGVKKNALVKLRLCPECSFKLNYGQKRKEVTKKSKKRKRHRDSHGKRRRENESGPSTTSEAESDITGNEEEEKNIWKAPVTETVETKPIEQEFDEYLDDLFV